MAILMISELESFLREIADLPDFDGISPLNVNSRGSFGNTPLHVAAIRGDTAMIASLLDAGAVIDAAGEYQYTPLHEAVEQGHLDAVRVLLEHGASLAAVTYDGETPLVLAGIIENREIEILLRENIA